ncbi:Quinic acid utilization activator [Paramyrothecium foliicola]|nr:Quinic acid utilization activator [Paramyrothecium foliicola]
MPLSKRASSRDEDALQESPTGETAKRRRVSLACNPCRAAREKCDGGRPQCASCTSQHRNCSYTASQKKRGVQTGYLRTIELALAWVLDEVPESEHALQRLLTDNGGREGAKLLTRKNSSGNLLHKKWNRSRVHKEIARILADGEALCADALPEESDSGKDDGDTPTASSIRSDNASHLDNPQQGDANRRRWEPSPRLKLPRQWRRLIDVYYTYTHCWLPLIDKTLLHTTASSYPPEGFPGDHGFLQRLPHQHVELWAVLALASLQDKENRPGDESDVDPATIFSVAQDLHSMHKDAPDWTHIRASLLHSLILFGQGRLSAAWLLVGTATRASLFLRTSPSGADSPDSQTAALQQAVTVTACSILDTWLSLTLGQQPQIRAEAHDIWQLEYILSVNCKDEDEPWNHMSGFHGRPQDADSPQSAVSQPMSTLLQLSRFSRVISLSLSAVSQAGAEKQKLVPEDIAKSLDPKFAFCNSLMGTTPALPSAYVLQATFLAGTVALSSTCRPSVLSTFMEVVENTISDIGVSGSPPILQILMEFMQKQGNIDTMRPTISLLRDIWTTQPVTATPRVGMGNHWSNDRYMWLDSRDATGTGSNTGQPQKATTVLPPNYLTPHSEFHATATGTASLEGFLPMQTNTTSYDTPRTDRLYTIPTPQSGYGQTQLVDYDSILDQLGSIDCTDSIELDPQFMVNLGFAPGCGFGEPGFDES